MCSPSVYVISSLPALSSHSRVALPADWQEDELGNLQQPGAGRRPTAPTAVPPEGDAAAGARRGGAASGLQAGGDSQGSPRCVPGSASRLWYGGAKDHASQRPGDPSLIGFPYNNEYVSGLKTGSGRLMHPLWLVLFQQESLDELKLVVGDTFENVASLQNCHFQQRDSVQTLGKILSVEANVLRDSQVFPGKQPRR